MSRMLRFARAPVATPAKIGRWMVEDCADAAPRENFVVDDSLSIIVPARNAEATLAGQVQRLLEVLPDLTSRFEIVIVDDGSSDHTPEIARDLARQYPQLRLCGHAQSRGHAAAVKTGLAQVQGQTIFVQEDEATLSPTDLRRLWSLRRDRDCVMARTQRQPGVFDPELLERLSTWGESLKNLARRTSPGGIRMIRRDGAQSLAGSKLPVDEISADRAVNIARCTTAPTARP